MAEDLWSEKDLAKIKKAQALAYQCVLTVEGLLKEGITEKKTADLMREFMSDHGVSRYFHGPFVWFGERTMLSPSWSDEEFLPTNQVLKEGMPFILDIAPIVDGYAADIGYTSTFGPNPLAFELMQGLNELRDLIPLRIMQSVPMDEIYQEIDRWIADHGCQSCHHHYPAGVIGHLVDFAEREKEDTDQSLSFQHKNSVSKGPVWDDRALTQGFGESAVQFLLDKKSLAKKNPESSPYWNSRFESHHRPAPGVWAVEPHFGRAGVGVKFEELLVVTSDSCFWLDDQVPHVRRWSQHPVHKLNINEVGLCR